ncbi:MAG: hypothetical protein COB02_12605 [Candidatus Cloacimonadota bacterium]|nr:MAG: hypothetical protein COB02_12605 [Candidatus Cloacimonadota bacterium]
MKKLINRIKAFTIIELLVAISSSTIVLGGFLVAFSSLQKVSKRHGKQVKHLSDSSTTRMMIQKVLAGATRIGFINGRFKDVEYENDGTKRNHQILYYYKYDENDKLTEVGYFFTDIQQKSDASYTDYNYTDATNETKNLYFSRVTGNDIPASGEIDPIDFDLQSNTRLSVMKQVPDFYATVDELEINKGGDNLRKFIVDFQITSKSGYSEDDADTQTKIFKGTSFTMGRVTG